MACFPSATRRWKNREANFNRNQKQRSIGDLLGDLYPLRVSLSRIDSRITTIFLKARRDSVTFVSAYSQGHGRARHGEDSTSRAGTKTAQGRVLSKLEETTPVRIGDRGGLAGTELLA